MFIISALAHGLLLAGSPPHGRQRCRSVLLTSDDGTIAAHAREVQDLHDRIRDGRPDNAAAISREAHNRRQAAAFNDAASFFASEEATPERVVPVLRDIAKAVASSGSGQMRILDVATGTGALLPFYLQSGVALSDVTGVDLSSGMLSHAQRRFPEAAFICSDFTELPPRPEYDVVVFNACFGNMFDQRVSRRAFAPARHCSHGPAHCLKLPLPYEQAALAHAAALLRPGGSAFISHPLGSSFVRELHASDPSVVPHELPSLEALIDLAGPSLEVAQYRDESEHEDGSSLFLARLVKRSDGEGGIELGGLLEAMDIAADSEALFDDGAAAVCEALKLDVDALKRSLSAIKSRVDVEPDWKAAFGEQAEVMDIVADEDTSDDSGFGEFTTY